MLNQNTAVTIFEHHVGEDYSVRARRVSCGTGVQDTLSFVRVMIYLIVPISHMSQNSTAPGVTSPTTYETICITIRQQRVYGDLSD